MYAREKKLLEKKYAESSFSFSVVLLAPSRLQTHNFHAGHGKRITAVILWFEIFVCVWDKHRH